MSTPRPPMLAASIIPCRNPADPEIFWVRRQPRLAFLGGFHSFPGGKIAKEDMAAAAGAPGDREEAACRIGALRELKEETALVPGGVNDLVPAGRWVTPPFSPARFDTRFYLAWLSPGAVAEVETGELAEGAWIRPEVALDQWSAGKALLAPPALYAVRGLAAAALAASGNDAPLDLAEAALLLTGSDESNGGPVTRIEMRPGFFLFPMKTRTIPPATHTNAFLIGGATMILVDPGSDDPAEIDQLLRFIERLGGEGRAVVEIWLTHHHPDHVGGVPAVAHALRVPVRAHPLTAEKLGALGVPVRGDLTDGASRSMPGRPGWKLTAVETAGHARGHLAFHEEVSGTLIAGDLVAGVGFIVIDPPEGNMGDYLASLARLRALGASALFPSHGPPTAGVPERLDEYIAHRTAREEAVARSLRDDAPRSIDEILPEVYSDVDSTLHPLARRSLLAHLLKLEAEGRVGQEGEERWRRIGGGGTWK